MKIVHNILSYDELLVIIFWERKHNPLQVGGGKSASSRVGEGTGLTVVSVGPLPWTPC